MFIDKIYSSGISAVPVLLLGITCVTVAVLYCAVCIKSIHLMAYVYAICSLKGNESIVSPPDCHLSVLPR